MINDKNYDITINEAADILDRSTRQVRRYLDDGTLSWVEGKTDSNKSTKILCRNEVLELAEELNPAYDLDETPRSTSLISKNILEKVLS